MEKYINQLIEELERVATNPPQPSYIEPPPRLADDPVMAELALVPFKTIEELTGIKQKAFPKMTDLRGDQWERINNAIFKVFKINGFYDDDGTKIDPETVPLPSLCVICKRHNSDDPEEKTLCLMTRYDQLDEEEFKCDRFEKI
jgi:hypothetical protein